MSSATVFPLAASKSAFLSFLVFSCTLILDVMSLPLSLSHPLLLCILQVMDRNRWIRNLGRKLKVYMYNSLVPCSILLSLSTYELPPPLHPTVTSLRYQGQQRTSLLSLQLMPSLVRAFSQFLREKGACWEGEGRGE